MTEEPFFYIIIDVEQTKEPAVYKKQNTNKKGDFSDLPSEKIRKMNKKTVAAAAALIAAGLFSACGDNSVPANSSDTLPIDPSDSSMIAEDNVDPEQDTASGEICTVSMPVVSEPDTMPLPSASSYLKQIMFVGDDMCAGLADMDETDKNMIFAQTGLEASDIEEHTFSNGQTAAGWAADNKPPYIYIWLGINDLSYCNDYTYYVNMKSVITSLNDASPDSIIAVMSLPPVASNSSWDNDNCGGGADYDLSVYQETIDMLVSDLGNSNIVTVDASSVLRNSDGRLDEQYDSGDGIHINSDGYKAICNYINDNRLVNSSVGDIQSENMPVVTENEIPDDTEDDISDDDPIHEENLETPSAEDGDKKKLTAVRTPYSVSDPKVCYLTFDDGPSDNTPAVLDILKENDIRASFFIVGHSIEGREDILKRIASEGHTIGIHTYSHDYEEIYASTDAYTEDFEKAYNAIYNTCGVRPWLFRYPGGSHNSFNESTADRIIAEMNDRGFTYFDWSCATSDASVGSTYDSCMENFKETLSSDYEVVLMHDSKSVTGEYLQDVIDYAKSEGYSFETLDTADPIHF